MALDDGIGSVGSSGLDAFGTSGPNAPETDGPPFDQVLRQQESAERARTSTEAAAQCDAKAKQESGQNGTSNVPPPPPAPVPAQPDAPSNQAAAPVTSGSRPASPQPATGPDAPPLAPDAKASEVTSPRINAPDVKGDPYGPKDKGGLGLDPPGMGTPSPRSASQNGSNVLPPIMVEPPGEARDDRQMSQARDADSGKQAPITPPATTAVAGVMAAEGAAAGSGLFGRIAAALPSTGSLLGVARSASPAGVFVGTFFGDMGNIPNQAAEDRMLQNAKNQGRNPFTAASRLPETPGFTPTPPDPLILRGPSADRDPVMDPQLPSTTPAPKLPNIHAGPSLDPNPLLNPTLPGTTPADPAWTGAQISEARDGPRYKPGVASGAGQPVHGPWLIDGMQGATPSQVADLLRGRTFANIDEYREAYWKAVSSVPALAGQFSPTNRALMQQGRSPFAPRGQQLGGQTLYHLHHDNPISHGGAVYDADNITVVTPRRHNEIHNGK